MIWTWTINCRRSQCRERSEGAGRCGKSLKCTRKYSKEMEAWYLDFEIEDWKNWTAQSRAMVFVRLVSSLLLMYRFRSTELSATGKGRGVIDTLLLLSHQGKVLSAFSYKILSFSCIANFFFKWSIVPSTNLIKLTTKSMNDEEFHFWIKHQ